MADQNILITIDDNGITVEGQGFQGNGCVTEISKVMRKMGVLGKLEKKPEYHRRTTKTKLEIKQNSD